MTPLTCVHTLWSVIVFFTIDPLFAFSWRVCEWSDERSLHRVCCSLQISPRRCGLRTLAVVPYPCIYGCFFIPVIYCCFTHFILFVLYTVRFHCFTALRSQLTAWLSSIRIFHPVDLYDILMRKYWTFSSLVQVY